MFLHSASSTEEKVRKGNQCVKMMRNCLHITITAIPLHQLNKLQKSSNCHHSRNCWPIRTQITTPKGCCKVSRETKIFLKSESLSQHQPLFLLQFGKTTALHFDSFHAASADFKAKVKYRDRFVVATDQLYCCRVFGFTIKIWTENFAPAPSVG